MPQGRGSKAAQNSPESVGAGSGSGTGEGVTHKSNNATGSPYSFNVPLTVVLINTEESTPALMGRAEGSDASQSAAARQPGTRTVGAADPTKAETSAGSPQIGGGITCRCPLLMSVSGLFSLLHQRILGRATAVARHIPIQLFTILSDHPTAARLPNGAVDPPHFGLDIGEQEHYISKRHPLSSF
ncbi:hypothetical protein BGW36DRAFT_432076 [Talaromyces proteolyticus]|uniref:Uncharacterized protein n=1 Tax=Talaromyces proteolyticus TaxID=1131652 RepID=A0AAD4KGY6_9EURO|nr:uncharacterized protein BGW36DRAFT_432076 [Talaromyces proteolyticus]KAH8691526.1 hypothetical protein BGW36DRAFT_432076 [Talaromyces proteolyticus]